MKKLLAKRRSSIPVSEVLTLKEVSQMLKVHPITLYRMVWRAKFLASKSVATGASGETIWSAGWLNGLSAEKSPRSTSR
jgi:hypothetical protein